MLEGGDECGISRMYRGAVKNRSSKFWMRQERGIKKTMRILFLVIDGTIFVTFLTSTISIISKRNRRERKSWIKIYIWVLPRWGHSFQEITTRTSVVRFLNNLVKRERYGSLLSRDNCRPVAFFHGALTKFGSFLCFSDANGYLCPGLEVQFLQPSFEAKSEK